MFDRNLTLEEIDHIGVGTTRVFFFGYVKYTDVWGHLATKGFCFRMRFGASPFVEVAGGEAYNYRRYEKTPPEFIS